MWVSVIVSNDDSEYATKVFKVERSLCHINEGNPRFLGKTVEDNGKLILQDIRSELEAVHGKPPEDEA